MSSKESARQFFFRLRCPTRLSFGNWSDHQMLKPKGGYFDYLGYKTRILVFDHILPTEPAQTHFGIGIDAIIEHTDIGEAEEDVKKILTEVIAIFSFTETCYVGRPEFVLRYRLPESGTKFEEVTAYVLDKHYQPVETSIRPINLERLKLLFSHINSIKNERRRQAVKDSLHWFWKALDKNDSRDRFLNMWIAIEHLETQLKGFFGLPNKAIGYPICSNCNGQFTKCPACKQDFGYKKSPGFTGYKQLETIVGLEGLFNKLHALRSKLVHGGAHEVTPNQVNTAIHNSHKLLAKAIFTLTGIDHNMTESLPKEMCGPSLPMIMCFRGNLSVNRPLTLNDVELQPFVQGDYQYEFHIDDNTGELIPKGEVHHEFKGAFESAQMGKRLLIDKSHSVTEVWERE